MINKNNEIILELSKLVLVEGTSVLDGYHCNNLTCNECPFSSYNNNDMFCGTDTEINYTLIAERYIKDYEGKEGEDNVNTKFQIGDKVFVKTDLKVDEKYNGYYFNSEMIQLLGKEVTIIDEMKDFHGRTIYAIAEDGCKWWWTLDMFEEIPTEETEEHIDTCNFYDESMKIKPLPSDIVKAVIDGELVKARDMLNELIGDDE